MRISYYPDTDSVYISLLDKPGVDSEEIAPMTVVDLDAEGNVVGIEMYGDAAARLDLSQMRLERNPKKGIDAALTLETRFMQGPVEIESAS